MSDSNWRKYLETDPFNDIKPSLLSSHDIYRYASKGCLVKDFDEERLLPAGYQFRFLGKLFYWESDDDENLVRIELEVKEDMPITIPANSIAYLHMQDEFRMPQYIAARFNLRITHVHQGLLLGTGPIVDPGFWGRILVPLHNLTNNSYTLTGGESLIHVEFTKLSPLNRWNAGVDPATCKDKYKSFPKKKIVNSPDFYFGKAGVLDKGGVVSNLNPALQQVNAKLTEVTQLHKIIEGQVKTTRYIGIGAALAILTALVSLLYNGFNLVQSTNKVLQGVNETAQQAKSAVEKVQLLLEPTTAIDNSSDGRLEAQGDELVDEGVSNPNLTESDQQSSTTEDLAVDSKASEEKSKSDDLKNGLKEQEKSEDPS